MKNVLIVGSNGMAGHVISTYLKKVGYHVTTMARSSADIMLDIENTTMVGETFSKIDVNYIINCIGLLVNDSISRPDKAALINSWFPHYLEHKFINTNTKIIHLSTDCVFNGSNGPYNEDDLHTETNFYGKSKSFGEINNNKDVTFRMSIIGPEKKQNGTGLFNWIINNKESIVPGWENAWWNGMTTLQLAKCIDTYIKNPNFNGIYHLVNNRVLINKYDLLCKINDIFELNKVVVRTIGPKTINKVLIDNRCLFLGDIPTYDVQLLELKNFVQDNLTTNSL